MMYAMFMPVTSCSLDDQQQWQAPPPIFVEYRAKVDASYYKIVLEEKVALD